MNLYYYTSTDTMRYILGNGDIYATNIRYMNDSEEYTNGLNEIKVLMKNDKLVKKWLKENGRNANNISEIKNVFTDDNLKKNKADREFYSISVCEKNDLLSQWAIYAKEAGVSIQMNFEEGKRYNFSTKNCNEDKDKKARWSLKPETVHYFTKDSMEDNVYKNEANKILTQWYGKKNVDLTEDINDRWRYTSVYVKRYDFYQEAERRIVFQPKKSVEVPKIMYRQDKNVLKPYLDIECENGWPIQQIMIGPGSNQNVVYNSVIHFLDTAIVKNGIVTLTEYIERIQSYFQKCKEDLKDISLYKQLENAFEHPQILENIGEMYVVQRILGSQVQLLCEEICDSVTVSEETKQYIKNNYFSRCGIIVLKSSIPYIF